MVKLFMLGKRMKLPKNQNKMKGKGGVGNDKKIAIHSVVAIASEPIFEYTRYVRLGMNVDLKRSTFICEKIFAMEWFHWTATRGLKYQRMLLGKILKNTI